LQESHIMEKTQIFQKYKNQISQNLDTPHLKVKEGEILDVRNSLIGEFQGYNFNRLRQTKKALSKNMKQIAGKVIVRKKF